MEFVHLSVRSPVFVSDCVHSISPESLDHFFFPHQTWYGGVLTRGDVSCRQKKLFTVFNIKVTVRAYILLAVSNCLDNFCKIRTSSYEVLTF